MTDHDCQAPSPRETPPTKEDRLRMQLASDLHDGLLQYVIAARMMTEALRNRLRAASLEVPPESSMIESYLQQAIAEGRRLIEQLHGGKPNRFDLVDGLRQLARELDDEGHVACELELAGTVPENGELCEVLYRIAQEAFSNIRRHSRARSARVTLVSRPERVRLEVIDDGQGFDADSIHQHKTTGARVGLTGLRRRVEALGGHLEIRSAPSQGTSLTIELPVPRSA